MTMKSAIVLPGGDAAVQLDLALLAERHGWDGVFVWEGAYGVDAWTLLGAMAAVTSEVRLGTMLTPLPWRRPWKVASQVATMDRLSGGRAILAVGIGAIDLANTGEVTDVRTRAEMMDEGIDLIRALWAGGTSFHGAYYDYETERDDLNRVVRPVQERIPIWAVGVWPKTRSMRRIVRACDGLIPQFSLDGREATPDDIRDIRIWLAEHGGSGTLDVVAEGETSATDPVLAGAHAASWANAGATWWMETRWEMPHDSAERMREVEERIAAGPPSH
jgi:alkanesulfonate monooxygenase SsuD/methylene tetrahydromethanopterin reductase-like flavin-dependent oxidoreductase (luciferase family)